MSGRSSTADTRFRMKIICFNFSISHVPGKELATADTLSRAAVSQPCERDDDFVTEVTNYVNCVIANGNATENRLKEIAKLQAEDNTCRRLIAMCTSEWPPVKNSVIPECQPFWPHRYHLTLSEQGLLLFDHRLVIPKGLRIDMLDRIHCGHQGIVRCKDCARESIWWPGRNREIEQMVENCFRCASLRQIRHEPMLPAELPAYPWQVVGTDILSFRDKDYLVVVDYYSRYIEVSLLPDKTTRTVINLMKSMFSRHGIPETVRCDNEPCYSAFEFSEFAKAYQFQLITSSPKYAQSNGEAKRPVATVRKMIEKCDDLLSCVTRIQDNSVGFRLLIGRAFIREEIEDERVYITITNAPKESESRCFPPARCCREKTPIYSIQSSTRHSLPPNIGNGTKSVGSGS
uniref:RNA-directed DNA polymerase n=1 Tax=Trichuris muris TaxID=70415 RepID=A0A5S6Q698_TRIMR